MLSTRQQLLLTCLGYLAFASSVSAQGGWANGDPKYGYGYDPGSGSDSNSGTGSGSAATNNDGNAPGPGNSGTSSDFSFGGGQGSSSSRLITIHAVLACLVWVFLIPLGGILIRSGLKTTALVKIHAFLQSISYIIYVIAAGMGIYLVHELSVSQYSLWSDPHTKIGVGILVLATLMPFLGLIHHTLYKRRAAHYKEGGPRPGRTIPGYIHLWLGRALIVLGMVNGGLGLRLAGNSPFGGDNSKTKYIAYGVGAGIMFLLYVIFVLLGETRRNKERRTQVPNSSSRARPMVAQQYQPVRAVDNEAPMPPSYEQSQTNLPSGMGGPKDTNATARYS